MPGVPPAQGGNAPHDSTSSPACPFSGTRGCFAGRVSPLVARCVLVGTAIVLVVVGVFVAEPPTARTALLVAAACCASLDVLVARSPGAPAPDAASSVLVAPSDHSLTAGEPGPGTPALDEPFPGGVIAGGDAASVATADAQAAGEVRADEPTSWPRGAVDRHSGPGDESVPAPGAGTGLLLGRLEDGAPLRIDVGQGSTCHVVVAGTGALAEAVFAAVHTQLTTLDGPQQPGEPGPSDVEVRTALAPDLGAAVHHDIAGGRASAGSMPSGTAVAVRHDPAGVLRASVVLVPGLDLLPRRWDHLVEVSRHGCRWQAHADTSPAPIDPVLPLLAGGP